MQIKTINEIGLKEIAAFLLNNHKRGYLVSQDRGNLMAWAEDAEQSMGNGNPPMIEIPASRSLCGRPVEFTISAAGVDVAEVEDD